MESGSLNLLSYNNTNHYGLEVNMILITNLRSRILLKLFTLIFIVSLALPQTASAHASLVKANPSQGSHLTHSPEEIALTFNERIGSDLYKLNVFNHTGEQVTDQKAELGQKHRKLMLQLPNLEDGVYTVTFKVISADGHPISSSYTFTIGKVMSNAHDSSNPMQGHEGNHSHSGATFLVRIGYYLALLFLTGWTFWGIWFRKESSGVHTVFQGVSQFLKAFYLFMLLGLGFIEFSNILDGLGANKILPLFTSSAIGLTWLVSLVLAVISFWILGRSRWLDGGWLSVLLIAEAFNGHAFAFQPVFLTVTFDFIHLLTAAIWSGGLLYLIYFWKKHSDHAKRFLPVFSKAALISLILLIITGILNTFLFLPAISDVLYTWWGKLLIAKTVLVLAVIVTASFIRSSLKNKDPEKIRSRIKVDFTLMIVILAIVGIFTYLSPTPTNEPLAWHTAENNLNITTSITPKSAAIANKVTVRVETAKQPNAVKMFLHDKEGRIAPVEIPLKPADEGGGTYIYKAEKVHIPFAGEWKIVLRILDADDNPTVLKKEMMIFQTK
ncbi:MAG TPA: copper resistance protein CopC [Bacillales bacterium]|nr:copper resistance protein CopC [Bacillales bacterium]